LKKRTKRQLAPKRPTHSIERIIADIRALRDSNKSENEIRQLLEIPLRTFQRYAKQIHEEDKQVWYDITSQELESALLRMRSSLEETYKISKNIAENESAAVDERLEALNCMNDSRLNIVKLLLEYPGKEIQPMPAKHLTLIKDRHEYVELGEWRERGEQVSNETE
jgi:hypothetical protein